MSEAVKKLVDYLMDKAEAADGIANGHVLTVRCGEEGAVAFVHSTDGYLRLASSDGEDGRHPTQMLLNPEEVDVMVGILERMGLVTRCKRAVQP